MADAKKRQEITALFHPNKNKYSHDHIPRNGRRSVTTPMPKSPRAVDHPIATGSHMAVYIGLVFLCLRTKAGWTDRRARTEMNVPTLPSVSGQNLYGLIGHLDRGWWKKLEAHAGELLARPGMGDVLLAYLESRPIDRLVDPALLEIAKMNLSPYRKREVALALFGLAPVTDPVGPKPQVHESVQAAHEDLESLNPIAPQTRAQAVAQELFFQEKGAAKRWEKLGYDKRNFTLADQASRLPPQEIAGLWRKAASGLLAHLTPQQSATGSTNQLADKLAAHVDCQAPLPATPLLRRAYYLLKHRPV